MGGGGDFLRSLVKAIRSEFDHCRLDKTELIILESYSWHELTLLYFSDSFLKIIRAIARLRRMRLIDLAIALCRQRERQNGTTSQYSDEWQNLLKLGNLYGLLGDDSEKMTPARLEEWLDWFTEKPAVKSCREKLPCFTQSRYVREPVTEDAQQTAAAAQLVPFGTHVIFNTTPRWGFGQGFWRRHLRAGTGMAVRRLKVYLRAQVMAPLQPRRENLPSSATGMSRLGMKAA